jgi:general secretion pathway protein N
MRRSIRAAFFLLALFLVYLAMLPSTWLDALLQRASQGTLAMTGTTGTFWRGEGSLQALLPGGEAVTLVPLAWKVALAELAVLRLHMTASSTQGGRPVLDITLTPGEIRIHEAKLDLPAALLGVLSPTLKAAALSGRLALQATDVRVEAGRASGEARAVWRSAGSGLTRVRPLGSYQLDLTGQGSGLEFRLSTLSGPLVLGGTGRWQPEQKIVFNGTATPAEAKRQDLVPLLRILGREISPGTYRLELAPNIGAV